MDPARVPPEELLAHVGFLRTLAARLVGDGPDADDAVQDTLVQALERPPAAGNTKGWFSRVLGNVVRQRRRAAQRRGYRERRAHKAASAPPAADVAERLEVEQRVIAAVVALPEPLRGVVVLRFHEGASISEIARRYGVARKTVRTRIAEAFDRLRHQLDRAHGGDRAAWSTLLLASRPVARGGSTAAALGSLIWMWSTKKTIATILALLVLGGVAVTWSRTGPNEGRSERPPPRATRTPAESVAGREQQPAERNGQPGPAAPAQLAVVVLDRATGSAIAGADVEVSGPALRTGPARTDDEGVARLAAPAPSGDLELLVRRAGYLAHRRALAGIAAPVRVALEAGIPVSGSVVDAASSARVAGATVVATMGGRDLAATMVTDSHGRFSIPAVVSGYPFEVTARAPGYGPATVSTRMETSGGIEIVLGRGASVAGRVLGPDGRPVAGAEVTVHRLAARDRIVGPPRAPGLDPLRTWSVNEPLARTTTDGDGRYVVVGLAAPCRYGLRSRLRHREAQTAVLALRAPDRYPVPDLQLGRDPVVDVVLQHGGSDGAAVVMRANGTTVFGEPIGAGVYRVRPLWRGAHVLDVSARGRAPLHREIVVGGNASMRIPVSLEAIGTRLRVRVVDDADGRALPGATVSCAQADQHAEGRTDAEGRVELAGFRAAPARLFVVADGGSHAPVDGDVVRPGRDEHVVRLVRLPVVVGRIQPVPVDRRVALGLLVDGRTQETWHVPVGTNGDFRTPLPVSPGRPFLLSFATPGRATLLRRGIAPEAWHARDLGLLHLPAAESVRGAVVDEAGRPIAGARIVVLRPPLRQRTVFADAAGRFLAADLRDGTHTLYVSAAGFEGREIVAEPGALARVELRRATVLTVRVLDREGMPVQRDTVTLERIDGEGAYSTVCENGVAVCHLRGRGRWRVRRRGGGGETVVELAAGESVEVELRD